MREDDDGEFGEVGVVVIRECGRSYVRSCGERGCKKGGCEEECWLRLRKEIADNQKKNPM